MTCDCASAGSTRRTAGAAIAPRPDWTSVRREIVRRSFIVTSLVSLHQSRQCAVWLSCGIAAVGIENVAGIEIRSFRRQEQQWPGEIFRLAQPAFRHAGEEARARGLAAFVVGEHPGRERRTKHGWANRIYGDAGR